MNLPIETLESIKVSHFESMIWGHIFGEWRFEKFVSSRELRRNWKVKLRKCINDNVEFRKSAAFVEHPSGLAARKVDISKDFMSAVKGQTWKWKLVDILFSNYQFQLIRLSSVQSVLLRNFLLERNLPGCVFFSKSAFSKIFLDPNREQLKFETWCISLCEKLIKLPYACL